MKRTNVAAGLIVFPLLLGLAGCASSTIPSSSTLDKKAELVCTVRGSTPLPRTGTERVVGAADSTVEVAKKIVGADYRDSFDKLAAGLGGGNYLALCFDQVDPKGVPANGRVIIAQLDGAAGSAIIGTW